MAQGRKTGGRQPGSVNKSTAQVKEALQFAFDEIGGPEALATWARENQTAFYQLWGRMMPAELKATLPQGTAFTIVTGVPKPARNDLVE